MLQRWVSILCYLDLTTGEKPSFSKLCCAAILVASIAQRNLSLGVVIALLSASFGRSMWTAFLVRWKGETQEIVTEQRQEIIERRDPVLGAEPA